MKTKLQAILVLQMNKLQFGILSSNSTVNVRKQLVNKLQLIVSVIAHEKVYKINAILISY